jgi:hypothetical protein
MVYKIKFQYKPQGQFMPYDTSQDQELVFKNGEFIPIPDIGDSVSYSFDNERKPFKVLSRHFSYRSDPGGESCLINIVVTDISLEEMAARRKK